MYGVNDSVADVGGAGLHTAVAAPPVGADTIVHVMPLTIEVIAVSMMGVPASTVRSVPHVIMPPQPSSTAPLQLSSMPLLQISAAPGSTSPAHVPPQPALEPIATQVCVPLRHCPTPRVD